MESHAPGPAGYGRDPGTASRHCVAMHATAADAIVRRPERVRIVRERCIDCGACIEIAPRLIEGTPLRASAEVLDAMADCLAGAIQWYEPGHASWPARV